MCYHRRSNSTEILSRTRKRKDDDRQSKKKMDKTKTAKIATIALVIAIAIIHFITTNGGIKENEDFYKYIAIYVQAPWHNRLTYHFFHDNIFHLILNAWTLLSVVFAYNTTLNNIIAAFIVASTIPECCIYNNPTIGMSALVFYMLGAISFTVKDKIIYQLWMMAFIAIGYYISNTNFAIHLYTYAVGVISALFTEPIIKRKKSITKP